MSKVTIFWFRRDLRLKDNASLFYALKESNPVQPIFIFDTEILDKLDDKKDPRVEFIHQEVTQLNEELKVRNTTLDVHVGKPLDIWKQLIEDYDVDAVYANRDYEPYARERDLAIHQFLESKSIPFKAKKDHVIFEKDEIVKDDGKPYTVYTPYSRKWKAKLNAFYQRAYPSELVDHWNETPSKSPPALEGIGFFSSGLSFPDRKLNKEVISKYHDTRDIPSVAGTSRLSIHLRFGTISIRKLVREATGLNEKYLNELIWRDFYQAILWHFPRVVHENFHRKYDGIEWRNNEAEFEKWCEGQTGYPIVDAGMRELNNTGFMHNRVRMVVASFLTKHLLIDWRWGEAYFAQKLLDYELASNNGGWQWAAGTGVDAAPYFRIFNPYTQTEKFDKDLSYVKKWVSELDSTDYPDPIVDHKLARQRALDTYKVGIS
ncbi:MAG: deoxyribodipyrimidine photo-lyase [Cyclobacteriaceae bacterium]